MKNQPAFPQPEPIFNEFHKDYGKDRGMTLRDYFAAKALQGFIAYATAKGIYVPPDDELASSSYQLADAMMKAME
jgi:hypothetical protein